MGAQTSKYVSRVRREPDRADRARSDDQPDNGGKEQPDPGGAVHSSGDTISGISGGVGWIVRAEARRRGGGEENDGKAFLGI